MRMKEGGPKICGKDAEGERVCSGMTGPNFKSGFRGKAGRSGWRLS